MPEKNHATEPQPQSGSHLHIDAKREGDRPVVLTTEDEDRFVKSCRWVVEQSRLGDSRQALIDELNALFAHVREWAAHKADRIRACFAAPRDDQIAVFVIPRSERYDFDLADELTRLDFELAEKFQLCACDVLEIPASSSLIGHPHTVWIHGDLRTAQGKVAQ